MGQAFWEEVGEQQVVKRELLIGSYPHEAAFPRDSVQACASDQALDIRDTAALGSIGPGTRKAGPARCFGLICSGLDCGPPQAGEHIVNHVMALA